MDFLHDPSPMVSQGKGVTLLAAKASGVMELVELYHAEYITLPLKLESAEELKYLHDVINIDKLPRTASSRFHDDLRMLWIEGCDVVQNKRRWVLYELVQTDYTLPEPTSSGCFLASSNGLASGNHLLEAISHGICEVIERDCTSLWTQQSVEQQKRTRLDLNTVDHPDCLTVLSKYRQANVEVLAWETTTEIGIPSFICTIIDKVDNGRLVVPASGSGCHPARYIALLRALTEAAQSRLTHITGSRDDAIFRGYDPDQQMLRQYRDQMEAGNPMRNFHHIPNWEGDTVDDDLKWLLQRLLSAGFDEVVAVDLTKQELRIAVVRIIIPGLEAPHHGLGYLPGNRAKALRGCRQ